MPLLLLVIDNYFAFGENYESLEGDITTLLRSGFRCGIQVIVSANRMNDMKFRLRQNITRSYRYSLTKEWTIWRLSAVILLVLPQQ